MPNIHVPSFLAATVKQAILLLRLRGHVWAASAPAELHKAAKKAVASLEAPSLTATFCFRTKAVVAQPFRDHIDGAAWCEVTKKFHGGLHHFADWSQVALAS